MNDTDHQATSDEPLPDVRIPPDIVREAQRYLNDVRTDGLTCQYGSVTELLIDVMKKGVGGLRRISYFDDREKSRTHFDSEDVGKPEPTTPPEPKSHEPIEKRAVRLTVELAQVLRDLSASEDESDCRLKEGIVEALEKVAGLEVG